MCVFLPSKQNNIYITSVLGIYDYKCVKIKKVLIKGIVNLIKVLLKMYYEN